MSQSVYAEFGVSTGAITGSVEDLNEHQRSMLDKDVAVRDGDDSITFKDLAEARAEESASQGAGVETEVTTEGETGAEGQETDIEFQELGDTPVELTESLEALNENEAAFGDLVQNAIDAGKVTAEEMSAIKSEYATKGEFSEASYAKLLEAGYSKRFVDSFVRGQEAMAEQYAAGVVRFAGGADQFNRILSHLDVNDKSTKEALESAIVRKDLATTKAILNLAGRTLGKTKGVSPARTMTASAKPVTTVAASKTEGFESKADMVKAMSDKRYLRDSAYTQQVRAKVASSGF